MKITLRNLAMYLAVAGAASFTTQAAPTVIFSEDFEWLENGTETQKYTNCPDPCYDEVADNTPGKKSNWSSSQYIGSFTEGTVFSAYDNMMQRGYEISMTKAADKKDRTLASIAYVMKNYFKFGLTGYYGGITFPMPKGVAGTATVEFDWCPQSKMTDGVNGAYDAVELVVIVTNGEDEKQFAVPAGDYAAGQPLHWTHAVIALEGAVVNEGTKIQVRHADSQWPDAGGRALRWYFDNFKVSGEAVAEAASFFHEDFEWFGDVNELGQALNTTKDKAGDAIGENNASSTAPQLAAQYTGSTVEGTARTAYDQLVERGYDFPVTCAPGKDPRKPQNQNYLQKNYLKFGLTGYFSGLTLPVVKADVQGNGAISFDWCPQRKGATGPFDPVKLVVIVDNDGTQTQHEVPACTLADGAAFEWIPVTIDLPELKKGSLITIRPCDEQWPSPDASAILRWYIDNIDLKGAVSGFDAPEIYIRGTFNEWGAPADCKMASDYTVNDEGNIIYTYTTDAIEGEVKFATEDWKTVDLGLDGVSTVTPGTYTLDVKGANLNLVKITNAKFTLSYPATAGNAATLKIEGTYYPERKAFAYDAKAELGANNNLTVTYKASAQATSASIVLIPEEGDAVVIDLPAPVKGANEATVSAANLAKGSYAWQINLVSDYNGEMTMAYQAPTEWQQMDSRNRPATGGIVWIKDTTSPAYGYAVAGYGMAGGYAVYDPTGELQNGGRIFTGYSKYNPTNGSSTTRGDALRGYAVFADWSDKGSGVWLLDPLAPTTEPRNMFMVEGATQAGSGAITYNGVQTGSGTPTVAFQGSGEETKMFTFDEDIYDNTLVRYDLGEATSVVAAPTLVMTSSKGKMANTNIEVEAMENGFFVSQNRDNANDTGVPGLMYFNNEGELIWDSGNQNILGDNTSSLGISSGVAVSHDGSRLALSGYGYIYIFDLDFNAYEEPVLTNMISVKTPFNFGTRSNSWMQLTFDAADNLHVFDRCAGGYCVYVIPGESTATTEGNGAIEISDGIENITIDANAPVEYFNLQGIRVENPSNGIFIRRQGNTATKVTVK